MSIETWLSRRIFNLVHRNNLVYNTCWEDPRLDRQALELGSDDDVLVITSAGCNALDYALQGPRHVYAVDMNPRQNALLELKLAAIRNLDFDQFWEMFGRGHIHAASQLYRHQLRHDLADWPRSYWDRHIRFFENPRRPFYFRGTSGNLARALNVYVDRVIRARRWCNAMLSAQSIDEQREIYHKHLRDRFWSRPVRFAMGRNTTLSLVGVPRAQRQQVERDYDGGIVKFMQDCMDAVFAELPLHDNYFWRVYMTGSYTRDCCPEYLKEDNFQRLKNGMANAVSTHTNSVQGFLEQNDVSISRFVLLDHMDWLSTHSFALLESEWEAILRRSRPTSRFIWRSGGLRTDFVNDVQVHYQGKQVRLGELLAYNRDLADQLHPLDRVHTYGSFYIARLAA
jgi:S-adenosylmethionine-diacylglycerol 3-amino-3-carboxypropyl transferase